MEGLSGGGSGGGMPDLFAKIGPLPAWAWGAIAVAGYLFWSHRQAPAPVATDTADTTDAASVPDVTTSNDSGYMSPTDPSSAGYDYGTVNDGSYTGTVTGTAYSSNQAWAVAAIQQLVAAGVPANTATSGITHYLSGATLTQDEANAVNLAITLLGPSPLPMPVNVSGGTGTTEPIPTPTPVPTPTPAPIPVVSTTPSPIMQGTLSGYQYDSAGNQISGPDQSTGNGLPPGTLSLAPTDPGYVNPSTPQTQAAGWYDTDALGHFLSGDYAAYQAWAAANPQFVH